MVFMMNFNEFWELVNINVSITIESSMKRGDFEGFDYVFMTSK